MTRYLSYGGLALVLVLAAAAWFLAGPGARSPAPDASARPAPAAAAVVEVKGMACGGCAARLEESLSQMEGVRSATVSLAEGQARLTLAEHHGLNASDLRQTVTNTGYQPDLVLLAELNGQAFGASRLTEGHSSPTDHGHQTGAMARPGPAGTACWPALGPG